MKRIVIVGANVAGMRAAETLRREGFSGALTMVSDEGHLPYDRPCLSKQLLTGDLDSPPHLSRGADFFAANDVMLQLGVRATGLDIAEGLVITNRDSLPFDALVIATGSRARPFPQLPELAGVYCLRTLDDAMQLRAGMQAGARVVVVGAGFIGAEVASSARQLGLDATIVELGPVPMQRALGPVAGERLGRLHAAYGTRLICGESISEFLGHERVEAVRVTSGEVLPADLVVLGLGVEPNVEWLRGSGIPIRDGVEADETLNVLGGAIAAAGDVASWPNPVLQRRVRAEQWTAASEQGVHAALRLLHGESVGAYSSDMYFWSDQYGERVQFAGDTHAEQVTIFDSPQRPERFCALYATSGVVRGVLTVSEPRTFARLRPLIGQPDGVAEAMKVIES